MPRHAFRIRGNKVLKQYRSKRSYIREKEALEKYGSEGSGKNLPFSSLSQDLKKKGEKKN